VAFGLGGAGGAQAKPAPSAAELLRTTLADASARGSMHEVETAVGTKVTIKVVADLATNEGRQNITHSGGEQAQALLVGATAYFSGNQAALTHYFGLPASVAKTVGTRWVSVLSSSSGYASVASDLTLASALKSLTPPGALSETAPTRVDGQSVVGIRGTPGSADGKDASDILYVTSSSTPLPVAVSASSKGGGGAQAFTSTVTLSGWGEHVAVSAPTNVISSSKL
jgi:hypothetical protein